MISTKFLDSLTPGQLVFANNYTTRKIHIIACTESAWQSDADEIRHRLRRLSKAEREKEVAAIDIKRKHLWSATALCGVKGEHAMYGNYNRYYWRPMQNPSLDEVCKGCLKEWRKRGEPELQGYDRTAKPEDVWPWELPFGWQEVPAIGHPWDVPADGDPELVKDATGKVVGERRVELRRFQRGPRIVRLMRHFDNDIYSACYMYAGCDLDDEDWKVRGTLQHAREYCHKLMATGGY